MFGCCNNPFSSCCRFGRCCACGNPCGGDPPPAPIPVFPPMPAPPAPPKLRGMQLSLTDGSAESIAVGAAVPFDTLDGNNAVGVAFAPASGAVTIGKSGTYLVNWWVAVENAELASVLSFALCLNGTYVQTSYSDTGGGQIYGTAIVSVGTVPSVLTLVNRSGCEVTLATAAGQAGMTVAQFA